MTRETRFGALAADARWQAAWESANSFATPETGDAKDSGRPKAYILGLFPYPSGRIPMGHVRKYAMGDVLARLKRITGHDVTHPMCSQRTGARRVRRKLDGVICDVL